MDENELFKIVSIVMNASINSVNIDTTPDDLEEWDSFNHIQLILALEENYSIKFTDDQIAGIRNVSDIKRTLDEIL